MTGVRPAPLELGRGVVIDADAAVPPGFEDLAAIEIDAEMLGEPERLDNAIHALHLRWAAREPATIRLGIRASELGPPESCHDPVWSVDPGFLFPLERLRVLLFSNNYDYRGLDRGEEPRWWFGEKAVRLLNARNEGPADVVLEDGTPAWIDGGPTGLIDALDSPHDHIVLAGEEIEASRTVRIDRTFESPDSALAPDQVVAATHRSGPARVIAPAGSGKTRTMSARLRHVLDDWNRSADSVVAVAYNRRAADELRDRADAPYSVVRTVHSLGWAILREARPGIGLMGEPEQRRILDDLLTLARRANQDPMAPYLEALDAVRLGLVAPTIIEADSDDLEGFAKAFTEYRDRIYRSGQVDHTEQIYGAIEALLADPQLRSRWQRRCRILLIDEFQDLTPAYLLLLRLVASPRLQVFGVGDDDQVIYGYSGADPRFLIDFGEWFPGATHYGLETNYRCPAPVVEAADNLLSWNRVRVDKTIRSGPDASADPATLTIEHLRGAELAAAAADQIETWVDQGVEPTQIAVLTRVNASLIPAKAALVDRGISTRDDLSEQSLNRSMVRALFAWLRLGLDPDQMRRGDIVEAIRRPSRGLNTVVNNTELSRFLDLGRLRKIADTLKSRHEGKWLDFCDDIEAVAGAARSGDAAQAIDVVLSAAGLASSARLLDGGGRRSHRPAHEDDLAALARAAAVHPNLDTFEGWLRQSLASPSSNDGVLLSSIHRVKGLEWPRVILLGADGASMPHRLADDIEEERRIFHVAMTRCSDQVVILADQAKPSPFLAQLDQRRAPDPEPPPEAGRRPTRAGARATGASNRPEPARVGDVVQLRGGITGRVTDATNVELVIETRAGARIRITADEVIEIDERAAPVAAGTSSTNRAEREDEPLDPDDERLFEALRAWRGDMARQLGMPAYIVFNDRTMREIARRRPSTERELLNISGIGPTKLENYGDDVLSLVVADG